MTPLSDSVVRRLRQQLALPPMVAGRYAIAELAGRGGMGEVYRAHDEVLGRPVALKVIAAERGPGTLGERLRREARVLAELEHPGVVPVHDAGELEDGRAWYVMRFVSGGTLRELLLHGLPRGEALRIVLRVAETLSFAHGLGIVHRDLKPANIMIGPFGEVLVLDWGVAKVLAEGDPGAPVGTPGYMAPEQADGDPSLDARADVYALGMILRELLASTGEAVPKPLLSIVRRATEPDAVRRYPTAQSFAEDLRRWMDGEAVLAHREGPAERLWRFVRRHQAAILLLLAYAVIRTMILLWRGI